MGYMGLAIILILVMLTGFAGLYWAALHKRNMHLWLGSYYFPTVPHPDTEDPNEPIDIYLAICDHYEPQRGNLPKAQALELVNRWVHEYPQLFEEFVDADGRPPQHSFFFPQDEYQPEYLDCLAELCRRGFGDVDIHLHHDNDTPEGLTEKLTTFRDELFYRHGLLRRDPATGEIVYGFIHGNWSLCNSHPQGFDCGVDHEIGILKSTGCYADFTMPSAPSPTQVSTINSIYYAWDRPGQRKSHDTGQMARVGRKPPENSLLMIQGPLVPDWANRKWGIFPRIENADVHAHRPGTLERFELWLKANVHVEGHPNRKYIKLHTHGCKEGNIDTLLGPETVNFHRELTQYCANHPRYRLHYVSAWEMACMIKESEQLETSKTHEKVLV